MEIFALVKDDDMVIVTLQGKKQPKVYLSEKNAKNAMANMRDKKGVRVVPFVPKG